MSPLDPRHGTTAGHLAHRIAGQPACPACVAAKTRYEKTRQVYGDRMVPAVGTRRRIHALKALGHSGADIARRMGITYQAVHKLEHGAAPKVFAATALKVAAAYEQMCMTPATGLHRTRIRNQAAALGYAPPLAWDDIDDPDEQPTDWHYTPASRVDQLRELDQHGVGISEACRRLRRSREALERYCHRHGISDVYDRMARREAGADRWGVYGGAA